MRSIDDQIWTHSRLFYWISTFCHLLSLRCSVFHLNWKAITISFSVYLQLNVLFRFNTLAAPLRAKAWFKISGAAQLLRTNPGLYRKLYSTESARVNLIEKDLPRYVYVPSLKSVCTDLIRWVIGSLHWSITYINLDCHQSHLLYTVHVCVCQDVW